MKGEVKLGGEKSRRSYRRERMVTLLKLSPEFKLFLKEHQDFLSRARTLVDQAHSGFLPQVTEKDREDPIKVKRHIYKETGSTYYQLSYGGREFFVKLRGHGIRDEGYNQARATKKAENILHRAKIENVRVVPWHLGYSDKNNHYFVAEWKEGLKYVGDAIRNLLDKNPKKQINWRKEIMPYRMF